VRHAEDLIWPGRLEELKKHYSNFSLQITLSQPNSSWSGFSGRVTEHVSSFFKEEGEYYLCGSLEMVKEMRIKLVEKGILNNKIHFEIF
jgi:CDP-4-dehydro-6-deoxyglucose reductase